MSLSIIPLQVTESYTCVRQRGEIQTAPDKDASVSKTRNKRKWNAINSIEKELTIISRGQEQGQLFQKRTRVYPLRIRKTPIFNSIKGLTCSIHNYRGVQTPSTKFGSVPRVEIPLGRGLRLAGEQKCIEATSGFLFGPLCRIKGQGPVA